MLYDLIAFALILLGGGILFLALKGLVSPGWLLGWLKGCFHLSIIAVGLFLGLIAWDIFSYEEFFDDISIATINFEKTGEREYHAVLVLTDGDEHHFQLKGDQWQLEARIFRWSPMLAKSGFKPGYRLERLSGRYYTLEDERSAGRTIYDLATHHGKVDLWSWFKMYDERIPWLDALYGSATFVPMTDGALYEINLSQSGLTAEPLNERAQQALNHWQ